MSFPKHKALVSTVENGTKPACEFTVANAQEIQYWKQYCQKRTIIARTLPYEVGGISQWFVFISKPITIDHVTSLEELLTFSRTINLAKLSRIFRLPNHYVLDLSKRVSIIYNYVSGLLLAEALKILFQMSKLKFKSVGEAEHPEIALLEGIVFGYKKCCIQAYLERTYVRGQFEDDFQDLGQGHFLCKTCISEFDNHNSKMI